MLLTEVYSLREGSLFLSYGSMSFEECMMSYVYMKLHTLHATVSHYVSHRMLSLS